MTTPFNKVIRAEPHTPVYMMHRYFARRPHNVFAELISHYTREGDLILDPFCGGGVTVVEGLRLRRRVIGIDINPLATYVTDMQIRPLDITAFRQSAQATLSSAKQNLGWMYQTGCPQCKQIALLEDTTAHIEWCEWEGDRIRRIKYRCPNGHAGEKAPSAQDHQGALQVEGQFDSLVSHYQLWYPKSPIPPGDKTNSIISKGYRYFNELFTKRNLLALAFLHKAIQGVEERPAREFLQFALSSSLKWASKQSHLRGDIVEGWAMHAYWIYPRPLEINVLETFARRCLAIQRGKAFTRPMADFYHPTTTFEGFYQDATAMLWTGSADHLPLPDNSMDCIITDPPYGGNVNYGELADYWLVWLKEGPMDKTKEAVVNKAQSKAVKDYEEILCSVFKECHRVLKENALLVATFNCKDLQVITAFVCAVARAGFGLLDGGVTYQPPVRLYTTTVHAKEVGAFTGDFIFTFQKVSRSTMSRELLAERQVDDIVSQALQSSKVEIEARRRIYLTLIPLIARSYPLKGNGLYSLAKRVESQIKNHQFPPLRFTEARVIAR